MNKKIVDILVLLTLWVSAASAASASNRIALVIGNSDYRESALRNPINDAKDISAKLREFDFDVTELTNINKRQFTQAVREFHIRLLGSDKIGLFFYAGHAVEIDGRNYLIPLAADIQAENDVEYEAVDASRILSGMERAGNGLNLVVLDACRNNPFRGFFRGAKRGIRTMSAPKGSLIMYSAQPGEVADDGRGRNGLFTKHLLTHLDTQGVDVFSVFQQTARAVHRETNGRQLPYIEGVLLSDFYFRQAIEEQTTKKQSPEVILAERADTDQRVTASLPKQGSSVASAIEQTPPAIKQTIPAAKPADSTAVKNQATPAPSKQISHIGSTVEQTKPVIGKSTTPANVIHTPGKSTKDIVEPNIIRGIQAYEKSQWNEAFALLAPFADRNNLQAKTRVADMLQGNSIAPELRGNKNKETGIELYRQLIPVISNEEQLSDPWLLYFLGKAFHYGIGISKDYTKAMQWYRQAAERGYATAQNNIGILHYNGNGVARDYNEAMTWFREAAEQGHATATSNIGFMYEYGRSVTKDYQEAMRRYRQAAELGSVYGQYNLGRMYRDGYDGMRNKDEIFAWFLKAAEQGHKESQYQVGLMYHKGKGVKKDRGEAQNWYRRAADQGHKGAMASLR